MSLLISLILFISLIMAFSTISISSNVNGQIYNWVNYKNDNLGITFDYPSSWTMTEKTNRFERGPDISIGSGQQIFTYTAPTMNIQYFDAYVKGLSIGLNIGIPYSNLQIVENYDLNKYRIVNQTTATALYAYDVNGRERVAEQEFLVYKDRQVHSLKFRDVANNFDSQESHDIRNHIINSFNFIETPKKDLEELDRILAIDSSDKNKLFEKANLLSGLGRYTEAVEIYDQILSMYPKDLNFVDSYSDDDFWMKGMALYDKGITLYNLGNYSAALDVYDEYLSFDPDHYKALYMKAKILYNIGNLTDAIGWYDKSIEQNPKFSYTNGTHVDALIGKGDVLAELGRYTAALESYDKALEVDPGNQIAKDNKELVLSMNKS